MLTIDIYTQNNQSSMPLGMGLSCTSEGSGNLMPVEDKEVDRTRARKEFWWHYREVTIKAREESFCLWEKLTEKGIMEAEEFSSQ